ncbi:hypothetical protein Tco_0536808 [Tanacetum coccineum]
MHQLSHHSNSAPTHRTHRQNASWLSISFLALPYHSHLKGSFVNNERTKELPSRRISNGVFATLFEQDVQTFTRTIRSSIFTIPVRILDEGLVSSVESLQESIQERAKHKREYDRRMNDRMMQSKEGKVDSSKALDVGLVVTEKQ